MNLRSNRMFEAWREKMVASFDTGWFHFITTNQLRPIAFAYRFRKVSFPPVNDNSPQSS